MPLPSCLPSCPTPVADCEQTDIHAPEATVHEALLFSARLRLPKSVPRDRADAFVDEVRVEVVWPTCAAAAALTDSPDQRISSL